MAKGKATPPENELIHRGGAVGKHAKCKNCRSGIVAEFIKEIWVHGHNYYNCTLAEPLDDKTERLEDDRQRYTTYNCKSHDYQKNQYSNAMICSRCGDVIHSRDFFTNRNIFWCRVHNMKFSNLEYHKKKYHMDGKVVMDYIEYTGSFEEKPKIFEDKKRRWDTSGWGITRDLWICKERFDFHFIDYGFISKSKFANILVKILPFESVSSIKNYGLLNAGNDLKFYMNPEEKELIYCIRQNRVQLKFTHEGELVFISSEFSDKQKKELKEKYRINISNKK